MLPIQPILSLRDDVIPFYDDIIPECYATDTLYIRACTTSAKQTSRRAEDKQESRELAGQAAETKEGRQNRRQGQE